MRLLPPTVIYSGFCTTFLKSQTKVHHTTSSAGSGHMIWLSNPELSQIVFNEVRATGARTGRGGGGLNSPVMQWKKGWIDKDILLSKCSISIVRDTLHTRNTVWGPTRTLSKFMTYFTNSALKTVTKQPKRLFALRCAITAQGQRILPGCCSFTA